ncbi:hypothetical protein JW848_11385 [Candidatus Bipolaricaulota bacterium]|nr:hypothetical protein [Candidatus Bipolaricaulota bacterium]
MNIVAASTRMELSRISRRAGWKKLRTGMGSPAGEVVGERLASSQTATIISTGYCGALADDLQTNDVVLADSIDDGTDLRPLPMSLVDRIAEKLQQNGVHVHRGAIAYRPNVVSSGAAKRALRESSHALAVDTESGPLARAVSVHDAVLVVVRVILDSVDTALPFSVNDSPIRSALRHPLAAVRIARRAGHAAMTIGRTIPLVQEAVEGGGEP